jgi:hypothetical protein
MADRVRKRSLPRTPEGHHRLPPGADRRDGYAQIYASRRADNLLSSQRATGEHESWGEQENPCMASPLRNPPEPSGLDADLPRPSAANREQAAHAGPGPGAPSTNNDLQRLECSVQWLKHEVMAVELEAELRVKKQRRRLPRAGQLPAAAGISPVDTAASGHKRETLPFHLAPPLASERIWLPPRRTRHRHQLPGTLGILIASLIAGLIAYHVSAGGMFPAPESAQAASPQVQ